MNTLKKTTRKIFNKKNTVKILLAMLIIIIAVLALSFTSGSRLENTANGSPETEISESKTDSSVTLTSYASYKTPKFENLENEIVDFIEAPIETKVEAASIEETKPATYTTVANDSYYKIANDLLGDGKYCYALAEYNGANGNYSLTIGKVLNIPNVEDEEFKKLYEETNKKIEQQKAEARKQQTAKSANTTKLNGANTATTTAAKLSNPAPVVKTSSGVRNNPGEVDTSGYTYLGKKKITGYTPGCSHCCGNSNGITASGTKAQPGRTIAAKGLSFGTVVYIKGYGYYTVEDRGGFNAGTIDMAAASHEECYSITSSGVDCWIVQ